MPLKILEQILPKKDIPPSLGTKAEMAQRDLAEHIELYAAAFLKETSLKASDCVLVAYPSPYYLGYVYEFKRKDTL